MLGVIVPKPKAEQMRLLLTDFGLLDKDHKILHHENSIEIPIPSPP